MEEKKNTAAENSRETDVRSRAAIGCIIIACSVAIGVIAYQGHGKTEKEISVEDIGEAASEDVSGNRVEEIKDGTEPAPGIGNAITGEFTTEDGKRFRFRPGGLYSGYISGANRHSAGVYVVNTTTIDGKEQNILTITDGTESVSYVVAFAENGDVLLSDGHGGVIYTLTETRSFSVDPDTESGNKAG